MSTAARVTLSLIGIFLFCVVVLAFILHSAPQTATEEKHTITPEEGKQLCADVRAKVQAAIRDGEGPGILDREILRSCRESGE